MQQRIPLSDIRFHPHSFADHQIRLIQFNGQLFRLIKEEKAAFFETLLQNGLLHRLSEQGLLIESERAALQVEGYDLVIRHRKISFNAYPNEWCAAMLKDGMICMIDLAIALAKQGLTLADGHPWNLMYDPENNRPVFVDLGSIMPIYSSSWSAYDEFCRYCLYPLLLMTSGYDEIGRLLMFEDRGVVKTDVARLVGESDLADTELQVGLSPRLTAKMEQLILKFPSSLRQKVKGYLSSIKSAFSFRSLDDSRIAATEPNTRQKYHLAFLEKVKVAVGKIEVNVLPDRSLTAALRVPFSPDKSWTEKQRIVFQVLTDLTPPSVLDISSSSGWYAQLAATLGSQTISFNTDRNLTTQLYQDIQHKKIPMLPLIMDFTKPTPGRGLSDHWSIPADKRLACDLVLAFGLIERLVGERRLDFEQIAEGLTLFAKRWVLLEFISQESRTLPKDWSERFTWYSLDNLMTALRKRFREVKILSLHQEDRLLLFCEK